MSQNARITRPIWIIVIAIAMLAAWAALAAPTPARARVLDRYGLLIRTAFCPAEIQTESALLVNGTGQCPPGVLPADYPHLPTGYTTNLPSGTFEYRLTTEDGIVHQWAGFVLEGGGTCDPALLTCRFSYGYAIDHLTYGVAKVKMTTIPAGYRLAYLLRDADEAISGPSTGGGERRRTIPPSDLDQRIVYTMISSPQNLLTLFLFAGAEAPSPSADASVPDTAAATTGTRIGDGSWFGQLMLVILMLSAWGLTIRRRRGAAGRRFGGRGS